MNDNMVDLRQDLLRFLEQDPELAALDRELEPLIFVEVALTDRLADTSPKGFKQSFGLMVNYLYNPDQIEGNVEAFGSDGTIAESASVRRLARL